MKLHSGSLLKRGEYQIEQVLGQGGFGITYIGVQVALNRKVVIKEFFMKEYCERDSSTSHVSIPSAGSRDLVERFRKKFVKEAQLIAGFNHPNIIRIHDIFEENGTAYYVMEYHARGSLSDLLKAKGKLSEKQGVDYVRQVATALRYVHGKSVNHLDIKPGNILIGDNGEAVLIDFGTSKRYDATDGQETSTTPVGISHGYAPLEQYKKGGVSTFSPQTDIYALGATLYKTLTGEVPPEAMDISTEGLPPFPASLSASVCNAISSAMQPNRKDRPQTVDAFLSLLGEQPATPVGGVDKGEDESTDFIDYSKQEEEKLGNVRPKVEEKQEPVHPTPNFDSGKIMIPILVPILIIILIAFFAMIVVRM